MNLKLVYLTGEQKPYSSKYKGFGLTYNPTFFDKNESRYSQFRFYY